MHELPPLEGDQTAQGSIQYQDQSVSIPPPSRTKNFVFLCITLFLHFAGLGLILPNLNTFTIGKLHATGLWTVQIDILTVSGFHRVRILGWSINWERDLWQTQRYGSNPYINQYSVW